MARCHAHVTALVLGAMVSSRGFAAPDDAAAPARASVDVRDLRCEYLVNPLGIDVRAPRLSWKLVAVDPNGRGARQTAYEVVAASTAEALAQGRGDLWSSGEVASNRSAHVVYEGKPLGSRAACFWKVRVRDEKGVLSAWSAPARFTMGLLEPSDWAGKWIGSSETFTRTGGRAADNTVPDPWLRKTFTLPGAPRRAFAYVASVGYHELYVNGTKIGDAVLSPSVANHKKRARYIAYDITEQLRAGKNAIGLWLGVSWSIFPPYRTEDKPATPIAIAQAEIELAGGDVARVATDGSWKTHASPSTLLGVWDFMNFGGELYDANRELPDWCAPDLDDGAWKPATVYAPKLVLSAEMVEPNRLIAPIKPQSIAAVPGGDWRIDMGVNFAGWLELDVAGAPGDRIEMRFSERADQAMTHRLRSVYVIGPSGKGTFRNRFNYSVGRWIQVKGLKAQPELSAVRGFLVRTDYRRTGTFSCSNELLNKIYATTLWTFENLSLGGYVVDCPQRERMGYGGDAHATTPMALMNYDLGAFYTKWSQDWRDVQGDDGNLPYTAPTFWGGGGPGWSGFCITLPWEVYLRYGDVAILKENFPTMHRWLAFLETKAKGDLLARWGGEWDFLGDWLWPGAKGVNGDTRETLFFNNCYWVYNLTTASKIAAILGDREAAEAHAARAAKVIMAIHREFYRSEEKSYVNGFQAYLAAALVLDVPPPELREGVARRLEEEIRTVRRGHFHAGITGGAFLMKALLALERNDLIYEMATKEDYPSFGDMFKKGATTLWESWEGDISLCHSSYLWIGTWFHEGLAGIRPGEDGTGFNGFLVKPPLPGSVPVDRVEASYESLYGTVKSAWKRSADGAFALAIEVPPNTEATVYVPATRPEDVAERGVPAGKSSGVAQIEPTKAPRGYAVFRVRAGRYEFTSR